MRMFEIIVGATGQRTLGEASDTSSPAFKAWFGRSKVVDASGNPLRVYHGTTQHFDRFHPWSHFGSATAATQRLGFLDTAGNEHIIPVYLRIEHPLKVTDQEASEEATLLNAIVRGEYKVIDINTARRQGIRRALMDAGYDGLVYRNRMEHRGRYSWVIFEPDQVRSAISEAVGAAGKAAAPVPEWFTRGKRVDLEAAGIDDYLEGDEFDWDWRLCNVPLAVIETDPAPDVLDQDRLTYQRTAKAGPVVLGIRPDRIQVYDGWHRITIARERGDRTMAAYVGMYNMRFSGSQSGEARMATR